MISFIEPLYKSVEKIQFGWKPEPGVTVESYKVYAGITPTVSTLLLLADNISSQASQQPQSRGKISYDALIADVRTLLTLPSTADFGNTVFYFTITYVVASVESSINESIIVEVPPVGIGPRFMKDDPTINRHPYVFSDNEQRWSKQAGSARGAVIVDTSDYYKANITTDYTYDGTALSTIKSYLSDATTGSPAKLTTYTYSGSDVTKIEITDSTV